MNRLPRRGTAPAALVLVLAALVAGSIGCAARGTPFASVGTVPESKALVYVYRPDSIVGGAIRFHVATGEERIVYLIRGGYFPYLAEPGEREFWARTEATTRITETLLPGRTYYLRGGVGIGLAVGRPRLEFVSDEQGRKEVKKCKLLPPAEEPVR